MTARNFRDHNCLYVKGKADCANERSVMCPSPWVFFHHDLNKQGKLSIGHYGNSIYHKPICECDLKLMLEGVLAFGFKLTQFSKHSSFLPIVEKDLDLSGRMFPKSVML